MARSTMRPIYCLSIKQPWAWLILHGGKDVENRTWPTEFRGKFAIHASKGCTIAEYEEALYFAHSINPTLYIPDRRELSKGCIVGTAILKECHPPEHNIHASDWAIAGCYGFHLTNPTPLKRPLPCKGQLGFFKRNLLTGEKL